MSNFGVPYSWRSTKSPAQNCSYFCPIIAGSLPFRCMICRLNPTPFKCVLWLMSHAGMGQHVFYGFDRTFGKAHCIQWFGKSMSPRPNGHETSVNHPFSRILISYIVGAIPAYPRYHIPTSNRSNHYLCFIKPDWITSHEMPIGTTIKFPLITI